MLKRIKNAWAALVGRGPVMGNWGLDAARFDAGWAGFAWSTLQEDKELDPADYDNVSRRARALYHNAPPAAKLVESIVALTGVLRPLPCSGDEEWNEQAGRVFMDYVMRAENFDVAGRMNFFQAQRFLERRAAIDGDVAVVPSFSRAGDGRACFAFFAGPQVRPVEDSRDALGRPKKYELQAWTGEWKTFDARWVHLYQHRVSSGRLRGRSALLPAIRHAQDVRQIIGYSKRGVELAAAMGLVETSEKDDKMGGFGAAVAGKKVATPEGPKTLLGTGLSVTTLAPGRKMQVIADNRPSQEVMGLVKHLIEECAWAAGLDPSVVFYGAEMGSAALRVSLERTKAWQRAQREDLEVICGRIYRHVLTREMAAGRLRKCSAEDWWRVRWVPERDMSIDTSRVAAAQLALSAAGLADEDDFCLATTGKTRQQLDRQKAANIAARKKLAEEFGISEHDIYEPGAAVADPGGEESHAGA